MDTNALINALNGDLAHEYAAVIQYNTYAAMVKGPFREDLRRFFQAEVPDELLHAQYLADKIVRLGGTPTTQPAPVAPAASAEEMLKAVRDAEDAAVTRYTERLRNAEDAGDIALRVQLETFIADETNHRDEVKLMLAGWK
jgi:bacterioferritin